MTGPLRSLAFATIAVMLSGCASLGGGFGAGPTGSALQALLEPEPTVMRWTVSADTEDALAFYRSRNFRPAWTGGSEEEQRAQSVRAVLEHAHEHGLAAENYAVPPIATNIPPGPMAAEYEFALTRALLRYARDVRVGRVRPNDIYRDAELPESDFDPVGELGRAVDNDNVPEFLAGLPPPHAEYHRLAQALAQYSAFAESVAHSPRPGRIALDRDSAELHLLTARLALEDSDLAALARPAADDIRSAVRRFQTRKRLQADGVVGPNTIAALRDEGVLRSEKIAANMERWRWLPRLFERRYIAVNVPEQNLVFVRDGETALTSRVIVGSKSSTTPILRTTIRSVKANPPWNIPGDIAARDLLPYMRRNPNYLEERNMVLVDTLETDPYGREIDWSKVEPAQFYYSVRQLPGPDTALGALMLDMPNDFDVYLHDTPAKQLFAQNDRAVSNGCVRVEEILALASLVLTNDSEAGIERIRTAIASGETQLLDLDTPLPVYLLYWTVSVSDDGTIRFAPDRYDRDDILIEAMATPPGERPVLAAMD